MLENTVRNYQQIKEQKYVQEMKNDFISYKMFKIF